MKVRLFPNNNDDSLFIADILKSKLESNAYDITLDKFDLGIAIGGDGSFLHMVNSTDFDSEVLYVGVNNGTLGFLQEIKPTALNEFVKVLNDDAYNIEPISYETIEIKFKDGSSVHKALNEVVIRASSLDTVYLDVLVNDKLLERYVGDGLMISTPVGSTAYNLSGNGSIIYSGLHTLQITSLAPINNKVYKSLTNSVILPEDKIIKIRPAGRTKNVIVVVDGKVSNVNDVQEIVVHISAKRLKCLRLDDYDYTAIINDKFLN